MLKKTTEILLFCFVLMSVFFGSAEAADLTVNVSKTKNLSSDWSIRVKLLDGSTHQPLPDSYQVTGLSEDQQIENNGYIHIGWNKSASFTIIGLPDGTWYSLTPYVLKADKKTDSDKFPYDDQTTYGGCFKLENGSGQVGPDVTVSLTDFLYLDNGFFTPAVKEFQAEDGQEITYQMEQTAGETTEFDNAPVISYGNGSVTMPTVTLPSGFKGTETVRTLKYHITGKTGEKTVSDLELTLRLIPNASEKYVFSPSVRYNLEFAGTKTLIGGNLEGNDFEFELTGDNPEFIQESEEPWLIEGPAFAGIIKRLVPDSGSFSAVFTDEVPQDSASAQDVSWYQDRSVLAWYDDSSQAIKISSLMAGVKIRATSCNSMFYSMGKGFIDNTKSSLISVDGANLDVSAVRDMSRMFENSINLKELKGIEDWETSNVINASEMFYDTGITKVPEFKKGSFGKTKNMKSMFESCNGLTDLSSLAEWDVSSVTSMSHMFYNCDALSDISGLSEWDVSSVTNMSHMFYNCDALSDISGLSGWQTSSIMDVSYMFQYCQTLTDISGLSGWKTESVTDMSGMFERCDSLSDISGISEWDTSSVTDMSGMFTNCGLAGTVNLSGWDVSSVTDMSELFYSCNHVQVFNLSGWTPGSKTGSKCKVAQMFYSCQNLTTIYAPDWNPEYVSSGDYGVFSYCELLKGGIDYTWGKTDSSYCKHEGGYFTSPVSSDSDRMESPEIESVLSAQISRVTETFHDWTDSLNTLTLKQNSAEKVSENNAPNVNSLNLSTADLLRIRSIPLYRDPLNLIALQSETAKLTYTAENDSDGKISFDPLVFSAPGIYSYEIKEKQNLSNKDIQFDQTVYTLNVNVTEDEDGYLHIESTELTGGENNESLEFTNQAGDSTAYSPKVKKTVMAESDVPDEEYRFKIEQLEGDKQAVMPDSKEIVIKGSGEKEFDKLYFMEEGEYRFKITEIAGSSPDVDYDSTVYLLTVRITHDDSGLKVGQITYEPQK